MNSNHQQDNGNKGASLTRQRKHFTVSASPLNAVKLDLAIIMVMAVIVAILVVYLVDSHTQQFVWLGAYGLLSMTWLIIKSRKVLHTHQTSNANQDQHET
jgi:hypothetical protein